MLNLSLLSDVLGALNGIICRARIFWISIALHLYVSDAVRPILAVVQVVLAVVLAGNWEEDWEEVCKRTGSTMWVWVVSASMGILGGQI